MSVLLLAIAFLATGVTMLSTKLIVAMGLGSYAVSYVMLSAASAAATAALAFVVARPRVERKDLLVGLVMGASGAMAMVTLVMALTHLPAVVVFPVRSSTNIALTAALSFAIWRERVTVRQWLGVALAVAAVYLLV